MKRITWILTPILLLGLVGCKASKPGLELTPSERGSAQVLYEKARDLIRKNPERARMLFKEIMQLHPDSIYARRAKIGIADAYFKQGDAASLVVAASEYQEYVNLYPNSPDAAYAKFQVGECYFERMRKPERDQTNTKAAIKAFQELLELYPGTREARDAEKRIATCRDNLAMHNFRVGYYNYKYGAYRGAVQRFKYVIDEFPDFSRNERLFFYTGKAYMAMQEWQNALSFFQKVTGSYPGSKYARKAAKLMKAVAGKLQATEGAEKKRPEPAG
ncbi:MAG: outer membrane protein assembly factor BamD [Acidobacteriota bacterium]|jgi:outer membrane protein assembly factor BamD|nr:outer membrane protein assembly factor BamD [Acidobacteriota bacterium]